MPWSVAAAAVGAVGAYAASENSKGGSGSTTSTTTNDPWSGVQPYLTVGNQTRRLKSGVTPTYQTYNDAPAWVESADQITGGVGGDPESTPTSNNTPTRYYNTQTGKWMDWSNGAARTVQTNPDSDFETVGDAGIYPEASRLYNQSGWSQNQQAVTNSQLNNATQNFQNQAGQVYGLANNVLNGAYTPTIKPVGTISSYPQVTMPAPVQGNPVAYGAQPAVASQPTGAVPAGGGQAGSGQVELGNWSDNALNVARQFFAGNPDANTIYDRAKEYGLTGDQLADLYADSTGGSYGDAQKAIQSYLSSTGKTLANQINLGYYKPYTDQNGAQSPGTVPAGGGQAGSASAAGQNASAYANPYVNQGAVQSGQANTVQQVSTVNPSSSRAAQGALDPTSALGKLLSGNVTNPYLDRQAGAIANQLTRNLNENVLPGVRSNALAAGQYGSSRQGIAEGLAMSRMNQDMASSLANLYGGAYENSQQRMANTASDLNNQAIATTLANAGLGLQSNAQNLQAQQFNASNALAYNQLNANIGFQNNAQAMQAAQQALNNQLQGVGLFSTGNNLQTQNYQSIMGLLNAPNEYNWNNLNNYSSIVTNGARMGGTSTTQQPYFTNNAANVLGGASSALGFYKNLGFGNSDPYSGANYYGLSSPQQGAVDFTNGWNSSNYG